MAFPGCVVRERRPLPTSEGEHKAAAPAVSGGGSGTAGDHHLRQHGAGETPGEALIKVIPRSRQGGPVVRRQGRGRCGRRPGRNEAAQGGGSDRRAQAGRRRRSGRVASSPGRPTAQQRSQPQSDVGLLPTKRTPMLRLEVAQTGPTQPPAPLAGTAVAQAEHLTRLKFAAERVPGGEPSTASACDGLPATLAHAVEDLVRGRQPPSVRVPRRTISSFRGWRRRVRDCPWRPSPIAHHERSR